MLHFKDSNKLFEFKDYFNSTTRVISNLISFLDVFSNKSLIKGVFGKKTKGYRYIILLQSLLLLPFLGAKNINNLFNTHYKLFYEGKKDSLYEILKNPVIN